MKVGVRLVSVDNCNQSIERVDSILAGIRSKGVRLWSENGQLHYRMPAGALTSEDMARIRASKAQIIAALAKHSEWDDPPWRATASGLARAPLAFSQRAHLQLYGLTQVQYRDRSMRSLASAMRLRGRLSLAYLRMSVEEMVRRHPALRTLIVGEGGDKLQVISSEAGCGLEVCEMTEFPERQREGEAIRQVEQLILEPIDLARGPLIVLKLLRFSERDHVLIVVMEHLVSDGTSLNILIGDLFDAYIQCVKGRGVCLPPIGMQFMDYAVWQHAREATILAKDNQWTRLFGCGRLRFPESDRARLTGCFGWKVVTFRIDANLKAELVEWCRHARITLVLAVYTAYVALVLRWSNAAEAIIQHQTNGRGSPAVEHTVGYFASMLYPYIRLKEGDSLLDLKDSVWAAYCYAYERADFSCIAAQKPRPEFTRNTVFNWSPRGAAPNLSALDGTEDALTLSIIEYTPPILSYLEMDQEPEIQFRDMGAEIMCALYFSGKDLSETTMERFARNFLLFLRILVRTPEVRVKDVPFVS